MARKIKFDFNLTDFVPEARRLRGAKREQARRELANFIREQVLETATSGLSPVSGEGRFPKLSKKYAEDKKGGNRTRNLVLTGDMMGSLDVVDLGRKLRLTVAESENDKARGHNRFQGDRVNPSLPKAQFVPDEKQGQTFKRNITSGARSIIKKFLDEE